MTPKTANTKDWSKVISKEVELETSQEEKVKAEEPKSEVVEPPKSLETDPAKLQLAHPDYQELVAKVAELEGKVSEYWNALLRSKAELDNFHKRAERNIEEAHKFGSKNIIKDVILPGIDSLEKGIQSCQAGLENAPESVELINNIKTGLYLTVNLILNNLQKHGVVQINPMGEDFNPDLHEAMSAQEKPDAKPNSVIQVLQNGYTLNGRLLRPALVIVAKAS